MSDEFEDRMARWHKNYSEKLALWTPGNFAELARLHAENERLRAALVKSRENMIGWFSFAAFYYQEQKDADLAVIDDALKGARGE
jgi:hypothetical protein